MALRSVAITPGAGDGVEFDGANQVVKLGYGVEGARALMDVKPATESAQTSGNTKLDTIVTALASLLAELNAKTEPADTQAVSAAALPLPTGAATAARQDTGNTSLSSIDGKLPALSNGAIPIVKQDTTASGTITTQNLVPAGAATANSAVEISCTGKGTVTFQVEGVYTGALSIQARVGGSSTWVTLSGASMLLRDTGAYSATVASAATGLFQTDTTGFVAFRVTALAAVTGTATVNMRATDAVALMGLDNALPAGAAIIGALVANQSMNLAQYAGGTAAGGNGTASANGPRCTIASDNTPSTAFGPTTAANSACAVSNQASLSSSGAVVKASAGNVYGISIVNKDNAVLYVHLHNQISAPTRGTGIVDWYVVPANGVLNIPPSNMAHLNFATGIAIIAGTTAAGGSAPTTAPDVKVWFK